MRSAVAAILGLGRKIENAQRLAGHGAPALGFVEDDDVGSDIAKFLGFGAEFCAREDRDGGVLLPCELDRSGDLWRGGKGEGDEAGLVDTTEVPDFGLAGIGEQGRFSIAVKFANGLGIEVDDE